jgi:NAD+--dinitrogen-reductase ADP-D-ribosyltransferase
LDDDPRRWYTTNLVGLSASTIASTTFNERPVTLSIAATRATHAGLFTLLDKTPSVEEAAAVFDYYMRVAFSLHKPTDEVCQSERRSYTSSYLKALQGWGFDSNSPQGAVLKGWVESRFGLSPTFHRAPLEGFPSPAWTQYIEEKLGSRFHNNCINLQLDVLFEYCQWSIERFDPFGGSHARLYRGSSASEAPFVAPSLKQRQGVVRFNNLVSFSVSRERAEEFGSCILEVRVPCAKFLFYPGLLNSRVLNGEGEVLALGGDYEVKISHDFPR